MSEHYPAYQYVYQLQPNPLQSELTTIIADLQQPLQELRDGRFTRSQDIEKALKSALLSIGFQHSVTNQQAVGLFAEASDFELDFWQADLGIALEIEKGKHFNVWRDLCKFAESPLISHAVLIIPREKRNQKGQLEQIFVSTVDCLANVVRLYDGLSSLLVVGY